MTEAATETITAAPESNEQTAARLRAEYEAKCADCGKVNAELLELQRRRLELVQEIAVLEYRIALTTTPRS